MLWSTRSSSVCGMVVGRSSFFFGALSLYSATCAARVCFSRASSQWLDAWQLAARQLRDESHDLAHQRQQQHATVCKRHEQCALPILRGPGQMTTMSGWRRRRRRQRAPPRMTPPPALRRRSRALQPPALRCLQPCDAASSLPTPPSLRRAPGATEHRPAPRRRAAGRSAA